MRSKTIKSDTTKKKSLYFQFIVISSILLLVLFFVVSLASVSEFLVKGTTVLLNHILQFFHFQTRMNGNIIRLLDGSQLQFQIIMDCTGVYPFIILTSMIAGFPAKLIKKIIGINLALVYTLVFNYLRLVLLFVIGRISSKGFEIAHIFIWQISFVLFIVIFFFWWVQWAKKTNKISLQ